MFGKGGSLEPLYPLYEAVDTILYTPADITKGASHVRDGMDLKRMMVMVVVALGPCFFMAMHNTGYQANLAIANELGTAYPGWRESALVALGCGHDANSFLDNFVLGALYFLPIYAVTMAFGGLWEVLFSIVRKHDVNEGFLVTGALFPLTLPPTTPLWQVAIGISFGVVIGKEVFGGTGKNFLNPALTARAFLYFAYPAEITGMTIWTAADGFSGATPLGALASAQAGASIPTLTNYSWWDCFIGYMQGSMGETSTLACLLGAGLLIVTGIGSWRIMAGVVLGAMVTASLFFFGSGDSTNALLTMGPPLALSHRRICFRNGIYGDRPCLSSHDRSRALVVWNINRRDDRADPRDQSGIPRRHYAGHFVRQYDGSVDRLLCHSSQHQEKGGSLWRVIVLAIRCW